MRLFRLFRPAPTTPAAEIPTLEQFLLSGLPVHPFHMPITDTKFLAFSYGACGQEPQYPAFSILSDVGRTICRRPIKNCDRGRIRNALTVVEEGRYWIHREPKALAFFHQWRLPHPECITWLHPQNRADILYRYDVRQLEPSVLDHAIAPKLLPARTSTVRR